MTIDWTVSVVSLAQIVGIGIGGIAFLMTMKNTVTNIKNDVSAIQFEIKKMGEILTKMAVAETRIDNCDTRLTNIERDVRELRHGQGFIRGSRTSIDGEYPS